MLEPSLVDSPMFDPGKCFVCGTIEGRMVDTHVDIIGDGRVYLCERICVPLIANLFGYLSPEKTAVLIAERDAHVERVAELEAELEGERANKVVTLSDAIRFADARARKQRAPKAPAAA